MLLRFVVAAITDLVWPYGESITLAPSAAVIDHSEVSNAKCRLRVAAYREKAIMTPGAFYVFQSGWKDADRVA
jgi:hypothetical protein